MAWTAAYDSGEGSTFKLTLTTGNFGAARIWRAVAVSCRAPETGYSSGFTLPATFSLTSLSPQTMPLTFLPSHLKLTLALPVPLATCTGSDSATRSPPKATCGLPVFSRPTTSAITTASSYLPMGTTFLMVPSLCTFRLVSLSVTESTKPVTSRSIMVRTSEVGTPTRTPVNGIPWRRRSFSSRPPSFRRSSGSSRSSSAIRAFICSGLAASLRRRPQAGEAASSRAKATAPAQSVRGALTTGLPGSAASPPWGSLGDLRELPGHDADRDPQVAAPGEDVGDTDLERHPGALDQHRAVRHGGQLDGLLDRHRDL